MNRDLNYRVYSKLYESKIFESDFLVEQRVTAEDIVEPLTDLINEEVIGRLLKGAGKAIGNVAKAVAGAIKGAFNVVVNFFKNFSISKLIGAISKKIKEIGFKAYNRVKEALSSMREFIIENDLVTENNLPNFKNIWGVLCSKAKSVIDWEKEGMPADKLASIGQQVSIKESVNSIGKDEIKYYGMFEKIAYALGIRNARFNGVVSQIAKKTTLGLIIAGIIKACGLTFAGITTALGLTPVGMAAIGGMLLMAGLIILAIWICKPYPTIEDCLGYLHLHFGGGLQKTSLPVIIQPQPGPVPGGGGGRPVPAVNTPTGLSGGKLYALMIKNLRALKSIVITIQFVSVKESRVVSFELFEKKLGGLGKNNIRKIEIQPDEKHLIQAFKNIEKSVKSLVDKRDKGVGVDEEFIQEILDAVPASQKESSDAKEWIMELYQTIYEYLYGEYSKTLSDLGPLYKESLDDISTKSKRQRVAEKIARFAKRSLLFEKEGLYGGLGELGADLKDFNESLNQIMDTFK